MQAMRSWQAKSHKTTLLMHWAVTTLFLLVLVMTMFTQAAELTLLTAELVTTLFLVTAITVAVTQARAQVQLFQLMLN